METKVNTAALPSQDPVRYQELAFSAVMKGGELTNPAQLPATGQYSQVAIKPSSEQESVNSNLGDPSEGLEPQDWPIDLARKSSEGSIVEPVVDP
mmetsp:Transcript_39846/g.61035  ORF Transcript_39846/g.61035 Transcript_39846/m.61035 type:complete len:95 (+) Transcript_39846:1640-1924(+)